MAGSVSKECMTSLLMFFFFTWSLCATSHDLLSCDPEEASSSSYVCHSKLQKCSTFAIIRASSSPLRGHQLQFIPIDCTCNGRFYEAHLFKRCVKGDTFRSVAASLQGLTTCLTIRDKNPQVSEESLDEKVKLRLAVKCSCPEEEEEGVARFLVTYPVSEGESVSSLADKFNTTEDAIVSANNKSGVVPRTPALIPLDHKPQNATLLSSSRQKKKKRSKKKLMIAASSAIAGVIGLITLMVLGYLHWKKETRLQSWIISNKDPETRQLSLSIRTTSDKKISFEGSQDGSILDSQNTVVVVGTTTPRKPVLEIYAFEELEKATENFSSSNHIKGSVYFGSLKGKDLAIKQVSAGVMKRFDFGLLNDQSHYYSHNLMRVLGTCFRESDEGGCYLVVFEYAKNGSLWDWLQNKLAIKNQFIESCYCFLAWKQRIKICHDVAIALKFMHRINYVHGNIMSRNIFLNEDLRGKVGYFGMSSKDDSIGCSMSPATDVFSYGIIVMEVLSGQTPEMLLGPQEKKEDENRVSEWKRLRGVLGEMEMLREVMDSTLGESYSVDSAYEMARLATDCTAEEAELRPSAAEIVERVSRLVDEDDEAVIIERDNTTLISESSYKPLDKGSGELQSLTRVKSVPHYPNTTRLLNSSKLIQGPVCVEFESETHLNGETSNSPRRKQAPVSGLGQLEDASNEKQTCVEGEDCRRDGNSAQNEKQLPPEKLHRAALLKNQYADLILKARERTFNQNEKRDPEKMRREREGLELQKKKEKTRLQTEAKEAEEARRKAEAEAAAEAASNAKRKLELEREAAREALLEMEKSVEINENSRFFKDLELLKTTTRREQMRITREEEENGLSVHETRG